MRLKYLIPICLLGLVSCNGEPSETEENENEEADSTLTVEEPKDPEVVNSFIIEPYNCGIFTIGEVVPALPSELKSRAGTRTVHEEDEDVTYDLNVIFNSLEDLVDLQLENNDALSYEDKAVDEMFVHSNYYETEKGIAVGSTIFDCDVAYPDNKIWYSANTEKFILESPEMENVQFVIDPASFNGEIDNSKDEQVLDAAQFENEAKIIEIHLF